MMIKFWGKKGFFKVAVINSYLPKMSKMKAPLIPGRIMAQMAMMPHKKINQSASGV